MTKVVNGEIENPYQSFIHMSRYARWIEKENRRETWQETVDRYINFMQSKVGKYYEDKEIFDEVRLAILELKVLPSMRALMTSGPALERDNLAGYNCSYIAIDSPRAFDEGLYLLLAGAGLGFSVESQYVDKLPVISEEMYQTDTTIVVNDNKLGWAKSLKELVSLLYIGQIPNWDLSRVRPAGTPLKIFGGRASGPGPLEELFKFVVQKFTLAKGRRLTPVEAHDIMCKIGDVVVSGGVRRSALISFSDLGDFEMAKAKSGRWWEENPQRALANNTVAYKSTPSVAQFLREWRNLYESKSGERGIKNLEADKRHSERFGRREYSENIRGNPCGEILLHPNQVCNLTEVVVSDKDTKEDIMYKVKIATILGTWQASLTDFKYVRSSWKSVTEKERLLGVSMTGIFGNQLLYTLGEKTERFLDSLREYAVEVNRIESQVIGTDQSMAVTTVKPAGTTSQLTMTSSGIHPWHSKFYIRRVRGDNKDPMTQMLKDIGIPNEPDVTKEKDITVFSFPIAAPKNAITQDSLGAIAHLEVWKMFRNHWTEHNPSITVSVKDGEWIDVAAWVYKNFDQISGVSFLPALDHTYRQAPYEAITEDNYKDLVKSMPSTIDWSGLASYERVDSTKGTQELACSAGVCEIVDI